MTEPRKATDVLLEMEADLKTLLGIVRSQDLVIKVLSNKLNDVIGRLDKQQAGPPKIIVETVQAPHPQMAGLPAGFKQLPAGDPERNIPIVSDNSLPQSESPQGFRRNSRPETYAKVESVSPQEMRMPMQLPKMPTAPQQGGAPPPGRGPGSEVTAGLPTPTPNKKKSGAVMPLPPKSLPQETDSEIPPFPPFGEQNQIPVSQRCVDKNGKSIFLASVTITDADTGQSVFQGRTNGTGKWHAPLSVGSYRVTIIKQGSSIKDKLEAMQDVHIDGSESKLELPMLIIK